MQQVMEDLGPKFERATGHKLAITFATLGEVVKRIHDGESADVVVIPGQGTDSLVKDGKAAAIELSDGSANISGLSLAANRTRRAGLDHLGFSAEDNREQIRRMEAAGAIKESTRSPLRRKI